jgi:hypothetical protein
LGGVVSGMREFFAKLPRSPIPEKNGGVGLIPTRAPGQNKPPPRLPKRSQEF